MNIYLVGGLGNQLFQTALAISFHQELDVEVTLNCRTLRNRSLGVDSLAIPDGISLQRGNPYSKTFHRLASRGLLPNTYTEKDVAKYIQKPTREAFGDRANFYGYFQSLEYFSNNQVHVAKMFSTLEILPDIEPYIALHVRGGDYLLYEKYYKLQSTYYLNAIQKANQDRNMNIKVYTDDPFYASQIISEMNLKSNSKYKFEFMTAERDPWITFHGLVNAQALIVANSTFSWWAGWLASRNGKIVIRPSLYYAKKIQPKSFYPVSWLETDVV